LLHCFSYERIFESSRVFIDKIPCYIAFYMKRYLKAARVLLVLSFA
jgi:hypothetical protein